MLIHDPIVSEIEVCRDVAIVCMPAETITAKFPIVSGNIRAGNLSICTNHSGQ
jgi:hypothetical protein